MTLIVRADSSVTMVSPERLAALAAAGVPVALPGPSNGVHVGPCDHPDCNGPQEQP